MARTQKKSASKKRGPSRATGRSQTARLQAGRSPKAAKRPTARAAAGRREQERLLIRDVMTTDIGCLRPTDSVAEAARRMRDLDVGVIPVCEDRQLIGVVTDRDITLRVTAEARDPNTVQLQDVCSQDPVTIGPDASVDEAANLMAEHQIRRLPVVEEGELVGMVSLGDLAVKARKPEQATKALKEISEPAAPQGRTQKAIA